MLFTSPIFLFLFLPVILFIYYISPKKARNLILLLSSLFFYTWGEYLIVFVMIASTIIDFACGIIIEKGRRKLGLLISIIVNLSFLGFFKYANFAFDNFNHLLTFLNISNETLLSIPHIALPIGISFYTFQTMSYTIDVYRGKIKATKNYIDFATYVTLFPQLIAGPIVRYADIQKQLKKRIININKFSQGIERFIIGLGKKMIIANTCGSIADNIFSLNSVDLSSGAAWVGVIAYSFQIFYDFSGYSDMAIGLGKMLGFNFLENFNYPYISKSIKEFWRRWHISLSSWFKDYVYIPLGGNRVKSSRINVNILLVFLLTGLWHGASWTFIFWGLFHGIFLVIERLGLNKILKKIWAPFAHIYTLFIVTVGWVFFRSDSIYEAFQYISSMFGFGTSTIDATYFLNKEVLLIFTIATIFCFPLKKWFSQLINKLRKRTLVLSYIFDGINIIVLIMLLIISIEYIAADTYNPFIYFRF